MTQKRQKTRLFAKKKKFKFNTKVKLKLVSFFCSESPTNKKKTCTMSWPASLRGKSSLWRSCPFFGPKIKKNNTLQKTKIFQNHRVLTFPGEKVKLFRKTLRSPPRFLSRLGKNTNKTKKIHWLRALISPHYRNTATGNVGLHEHGDRTF